MAFVNVSAVNRAIDDTGEEIHISHITGDTTYDDGQVPTTPTSDLYMQALIREPNKFEIEQFGGNVNVNDKKFVVKGEVTVTVGDVVTIQRDTSVTYKVKEVVKRVIEGQGTLIKIFASDVK